MTHYKSMNKFVKRIICVTLISCLMAVLLVDALRSNKTQASTLGLPEPTELLKLTDHYEPVLLRGVEINPDDPFVLGFIVDEGNRGLTGNDLQIELDRIIKYFITAVTTPEDDLWVNLSPYESNRIIADELGKTQMGKDLIAQDYILKQLSSSMTHPATPLGEAYWRRVSSEEMGVGRNTFNKVWVMPDFAEVFQDDNKAIVGEAKLKVLCETDYLASKINNLTAKAADSPVKETIIPSLTKEVNNGKHFAPLRQIYNSVILATWFKAKVRESLYQKVFVDKNKIAGVDHNDPKAKEKLFNLYYESFTKGVYNVQLRSRDQKIKNNYIKRQYFSGGMVLKAGSSLGFKPMTEARNVRVSSSLKVRLDPRFKSKFKIDDKSLMQIRNKLSDNDPKKIKKIDLNTSDDFYETVGPLVLDAIDKDTVLEIDLSNFETMKESEYFGKPLKDRFTTFGDLVADAQASQKDVFLHAAISYSVREMLKNAFVYGSKLDTSVPIFMKLDRKDFSIEVFNVNGYDRDIDKAVVFENGLGGYGVFTDVVTKQFGLDYVIAPIREIDSVTSAKVKMPFEASRKSAESFLRYQKQSFVDRVELDPDLIKDDIFVARALLESQALAITSTVKESQENVFALVNDPVFVSLYLESEDVDRYFDSRKLGSLYLELLRSPESVTDSDKEMVKDTIGKVAYKRMFEHKVFPTDTILTIEDLENRDLFAGLRSAQVMFDYNGNAIDALLAMGFNRSDAYEYGFHLKDEYSLLKSSEIITFKSTIADKLLDKRPIKSELLSVFSVGQDMAVKQSINSDNNLKIGGYVGSGADVSNFFLSTNVIEGNFIDRGYVFSKFNLEDVDIDSFDFQRSSGHYKFAKYTRGYATSDYNTLVIMPYEQALLCELLAMGVSREDVEDVRKQIIKQKNNKSMTLTFNWAYPGEEIKKRILNLYNGDALDQDTYSEIPVQDVWYQRAGLALVRHYLQLLPQLINKLSADGVLILDPFTTDDGEIELNKLLFKKNNLVAQNETKLISYWDQEISELLPYKRKYGSGGKVYRRSSSALTKPKVSGGVDLELAAEDISVNLSVAPIKFDDDIVDLVSGKLEGFNFEIIRYE